MEKHMCQYCPWLSVDETYCEAPSRMKDTFCKKAIEKKMREEKKDGTREDNVNSGS